MADHIHHDETLNPHARGYQEDRIHVGPIALFTVGLTAVVVIVFVAIAFLMNRFNQAQERLADRRPAIFALEDDDLYPGPRLQEKPSRDMEVMRREVNERLDSYGWVDRDSGVAHIPIDRALSLILKEGLPTRASEPEGASE
ncbi:hypothetical protein [Tautonia rosea]|uniref:hypothetical protein n=1 Tax=Tautonia rosea TaxID=2728037 RepID=UPI0014742B2C|nr:hypothetical protein [Tautonia rosea]